MAQPKDIVIDFAFSDPTGKLVVVGWSKASDLGEARLSYTTAENPSAGPTVLAPTFVDRYSRLDLKSKRPLGFLMIFEPNTAADQPLSPTVTLGNTEQTVDYDDTGGSRLVSSGVDAVFYNFLLNVVNGNVQLLANTAMQEKVFWRLKGSAGQNLESPSRRVAFDRSFASEAGAGFVEGWLMTSARTTPDVMALAVSIQDNCTFDVQTRAIQRDDLHGLAARYHFKGDDGFAGTFSMDTPIDSKGAMLCLFLDGATEPAWAVAATEQLPRLEMLEDFAQALGRVGSRATRRKLLCSIGADKSAEAAARKPGFEAGINPERDVVLMVEIDTEPSFFRDIVIRFLKSFKGRLKLFMIDTTQGRNLEDHLAGLSAELDEQLEAFEWSLAKSETLEDTLADAEIDDGSCAIFARLSTLHYAAAHSSELLGATNAQVKVFSLSATKDVKLGLKGSSAFALACPYNLIKRSWQDAPNPFLTEEGHFRLLAENLVSTGIAEVDTYPTDELFCGNFGQNNDAVGSFPSRRDYDRAVRQAMEVV